MSGLQVSVVGLIVAVAAFWATFWQGTLLRRQIAQNAKINSAHFYQNITVRWLEFDKFLVERADLWPYFHADLPVPDDSKTCAELACMSVMMANMAEMCVTSEDVLGEYAGDWDSYFAYVYEHSPYFQTFWMQYGSMWSARVNQSFVRNPPNFGDQALKEIFLRPAALKADNAGR
ncbi:hypothetical protein [Actinoplanes regularis]|uniref:DUF4760 domain-containing protein n=1 Tax=Actinoplanes regularis TaxID=52697 RepID=A0A239A677_9ACTN|nr:hypothetical protein [Actinoplanes regularis]GIE87073.1 hypothetical protein Are01nite_35530 [Actinoplanes regularis]SNR91009.1 hypothetical protein SAMN06264365_10789 [Actinoplanes regularis]